MQHKVAQLKSQASQQAAAQSACSLAGRRVSQQAKAREERPLAVEVIIQTCLLCQLYGHPVEETWVSHSKFASGIDTDDTIHAPKECAKTNYSCNETFLGRADKFPCRSKNGLRKQGKKTGLGFYCGQWGSVGDEGSVYMAQGLNVLNFLMSPKEGASELFNQLAQSDVGQREGEKGKLESCQLSNNKNGIRLCITRRWKRAACIFLRGLFWCLKYVS